MKYDISTIYVISEHAFLINQAFGITRAQWFSSGEEMQPTVQYRHASQSQPQNDEQLIYSIDQLVWFICRIRIS